MLRTNRELVMLATNYDAKKHRTAGMYLSEKLDGMRCLWLPATRGKSVKSIPFANTEKDKREHIATGLWSRYGKVIHCPEDWVKGFPDYPLDGELFIARNTFQQLMSIVKELKPKEDEWNLVKFVIIDSPPYSVIFQNGRINNTNYKHSMNAEKVMAALGNPADYPPKSFDFNYRIMCRDLKQTDNLILHQQLLLPFSTEPARKIMEEKMSEVIANGGEGMILRHPASEWEPIRSEYLLKAKALNDAEATVVDYRAGDGKYLGMLGSLSVRMGSVVFDLSGFTDEERLLTPSWSDWARDNPGKLFSECDRNTTDVPSLAFPIATVITFKYRELTDGGVPKEARYWRKAVV